MPGLGLGPHVVATQPRPSTSVGRLRTVDSGRVATDDDFSSRVKRVGGALALQSNLPPWQSRAVLRLAQAASRVKGKGEAPKVEPMMVEGPRGTSLRALGSKEDHKVAGDALSKAIAQQRERRARGGAQQFATQQPATRPQRAAEAEDLPSSRSLAIQHKDALVFGAVYEHCDSTGRPQIISSTSVLPEQQFLEDGQSHRSVADLLTRGRGSSKVVWAGVGQRVAGVGDIEMTAIREAIVEDRSKRLQVQKLSGVKPYSKHGF